MYEQPAPLEAAPEESAVVDAALLRRASSSGTGAAAMTALLEVDPQRLNEHDRVTFARVWQAQLSWCTARAYAALLPVCGEQPKPCFASTGDADVVDEESVTAEIAAALAVSDVTATQRIGTARFLAAHPLVEARLGSGQWSLAHVRVLEQALAGVDAAIAERIVTAITDRVIETETPGRLGRRVRRVRARLNADAEADRIRARRRERSCTLAPEEDLQARITVTGPHDMLAWAFRQFDSWARHRQRQLRQQGRPIDSPGGAPTGQDLDPDADLSLAALRADAVVEAARLLAISMGETGEGAPRQTRGRTWSSAVVVVDAATALGMAQEPGWVPGYGWVPAAIARELLAHADRWRRFLVEDGRLLDTGRRRYRPSDRLREFIGARDQTSTFPTCNVPATDCDVDHSRRFDGSNTVAANVHDACRTHHRVKTHGGWRTEVRPDGTVRWISPSGQAYGRPPDPLWQVAGSPAQPESGSPAPPESGSLVRATLGSRDRVLRCLDTGGGGPSPAEAALVRALAA